MRLTRIYTNQALAPDQIITLDNNASNHLLNVLRLKEKNSLLIFDGKGNEFNAIIHSIKKQTLTVLLKDPLPSLSESPLNIHLGQAISRGEKMDLTIQKAVELGVKSITPLWTRYTGVALSKERLENKLEHWRKIMISSCEQSGRNFLPVLHPPCSFSDWLIQHTESLKLLLDPIGNIPLKTLNPSNQSISIAVGPEGGFSEEEVELAQKTGFQIVKMGPRILRTETAAPAMIAMLQCLWGDMG